MITGIPQVLCLPRPRVKSSDLIREWTRLSDSIGGSPAETGEVVVYCRVKDIVGSSSEEYALV